MLKNTTMDMPKKWNGAFWKDIARCVCMFSVFVPLIFLLVQVAVLAVETLWAGRDPPGNSGLKNAKMRITAHSVFGNFFYL